MPAIKARHSQFSEEDIICPPVIHGFTWPRRSSAWKLLVDLRDVRGYRVNGLRNACHARALSTSSQPWVHAGKRSLDSTVEALAGKLPGYRESFVATFDPICSARRLGARRMPEGGNNLHVSRIIRGPEHARTKPERTHVGMRRRARGLTCEHVNRPRPSCRSWSTPRCQFTFQRGDKAARMSQRGGFGVVLDNSRIRNESEETVPANPWIMDQDEDTYMKSGSSSTSTMNRDTRRCNGLSPR